MNANDFFITNITAEIAHRTGLTEKAIYNMRYRKTRLKPEVLDALAEIYAKYLEAVQLERKPWLK